MHEAEIGQTQVTVEISSPAPDVLVFTVAGEVDLATSATVRERLLADRSWTGRGAVVDLTGVTFLGSAGIMTLLEVRERAEQEGTDLVLVVPGPVVARTLEIAGVYSGFTIRENLDAALAALTT